jgi:hypothetical protein
MEAAMLFRISTISLVLSAALGLAVSSAEAASFDCAKAAKPDERAICANPDISALDSEMGGLWFAFSKVPMLMGSSGARMDDAQEFLQKRAQCGGDVACLRPLYHARIDALKQGIAQAMDNYAQLQNADPLMAPWSQTALPGPVGKIVADYADECRKLGGTLKQGADMPKVMTGDLDQDGTQDFVLDPENLECSAAATAFCGNGGCRIRVAVSSDNYARPVEALGGEPTLRFEEDATVLDVWVDGTNCNLSDRTKACWASYQWKNGALKPSYKAREVE